MKSGYSKEFDEYAALAQYAHWADIQYQHYFKGEANNGFDGSSVASVAYFLSSFQPVLEGWNEIKAKDPIVDHLLSLENGNLSLIRLCRNATFHFQRDLLENRIINAITNSNCIRWVSALKFEIERHIFLKMFVSFRNDLRVFAMFSGLAGWMPIENPYYRVICLIRLARKAMVIANRNGIFPTGASPVERIQDLLHNCPNPYLKEFIADEKFCNEAWGMWLESIFTSDYLEKITLSKVS